MTNTARSRLPRELFHTGSYPVDTLDTDSGESAAVVEGARDTPGNRGFENRGFESRGWPTRREHTKSVSHTDNEKRENKRAILR